MVGATGGVTTLIHFFTDEKYIVRDNQTIMRDTWRTVPRFIACMPNMTEFGETGHHPHYMRTDDARAITCPMCKETHEYAHYMEKVNVKTGA